MRTVYLAGPITGCNRGEAHDWRAYVSDALASEGIRGISPLRCEPLIGERYDTTHQDPRFGTAQAIRSKNLFDLETCDMTLAYLPEPEPGAWPSVGTLWELGGAVILRKPVIVVTDSEKLARHPAIACAGWLLDDLEDAIEVILGVLTDYSRRPTRTLTRESPFIAVAGTK